MARVREVLMSQGLALKDSGVEKMSIYTQLYGEKFT